MPSLVRQQKTYYVDVDGKRVPKDTPGVTQVREKQSLWYGQGIPGFPPKKRVPLAADRVAAQRMLEDLVRKAERGQTSLPDREASRISLADYLTEFERDLGLGLVSRRKAKLVPSTAQVSLCKQRIRDVLEGCGFTDPSDLGESSPRKVAAYLQGRIKMPKEKGGLSHQTAHFFLAAVQRFVWWLSAKRRVPVRADLLDDVPGFDPKGNRVHARRPITAEELARLLEATQKGVEIYGLSGQDRYFLYLTAFATGFRAGELAHLAPENFVLNAEFPSATLPGKYTKNKKAATCPLPPAVAVQLQAYLDGKPAGVFVWRGKWRTRGVKILRRDLEAAGIPYVVDGPHGKRYADFHALRHSFVTALAAAGVGQKELQELARHSDPRLTLGLYAHTTTAQLAGAVGKLAIPGAAEANPLAKASRADLESAFARLLGMLLGLHSVLTPDTPRDTPRVEKSGDDRRQVDTAAGDVAPK